MAQGLLSNITMQGLILEKAVQNKTKPGEELAGRALHYTQTLLDEIKRREEGE